MLLKRQSLGLVLESNETPLKEEKRNSLLPTGAKPMLECNVFDEIQKISKTVKGEDLQKFILAAVEGHTRQIAEQLYITTSTGTFTPDMLKLTK